MPYEPATRFARRYRDPITEFLEALYINFDFDGAQTKLVECESGRPLRHSGTRPRCACKKAGVRHGCAVLKNDFFLVACQDEFIENARLFVFET